ncbi:hypothetical protein ABT095_07870 [Kitasatospora sp. NPDC002227]
MAGCQARPDVLIRIDTLGLGRSVHVIDARLPDVSSDWRTYFRATSRASS